MISSVINSHPKTFKDANGLQGPPLKKGDLSGFSGSYKFSPISPLVKAGEIIKPFPDEN
jgi:hypothetical protein